MSVLPSTLQEDAQREKIHDLERDLQSLKLLNAQSAGVIQSLQDESLAKSNKILDLEMSTHRAAKVVVKSAGIFKPRLEMSSLVGKSSSSGVSPRCSACISQQHQKLKSDEDRAKIDLIRLYDRKSQNLKKELSKCQSQLSHAHQLLKKAEREIEFRAQSRGNGASKSADRSARTTIHQDNDLKHSDYILKLIKDNERLKALLQKHHIAQEELNNASSFLPSPSLSNNQSGPPLGQRSPRPLSETRQPLHHQHHRPLRRHQAHCPLNVSRSCEDIREAVTTSHQKLFAAPPPIPGSTRPSPCFQVS